MNLSTLPAGTRVTFICEKYSQARNYAQAWAAFRTDLPTTFIALHSLWGGDMFIPRNLKYADLPMIREPIFNRLTGSVRIYDFDPFPDPEYLRDKGYDAWLSRCDRSISDSVLDADVVVCACDPDPRGAGMFRRFLQTQVGWDYDHRAFPVTWAPAEDTHTLCAAFSRNLTTESPLFQKSIDQSEAKQLFDYNWALNALPLFGNALRDICVTGDNVFMSKYGILLLYVMQSADPMCEGDITLMMRNWEGSGKFADRKYDDVFGSPATRDAILRQLQDKGLLESLSNANGRIGHHTLWKTSPQGEAFLNNIHPDCYDPDIGFRIQHWGETWPASRPKMERYLRTYFGKQKRFARRVIAD